MTRLFSLFMDSMFHIRIYVGVRELMLDRELLGDWYGAPHHWKVPHPKYKQRYWGRNYRLQLKICELWNYENIPNFIPESCFSLWAIWLWSRTWSGQVSYFALWLRTAGIWFCSEVEVKERERLWHTVSMAKRTQMKWWMHFIVWPVSHI